MREYFCFCGMCGRNHSYKLTPAEFRELAGLPGALKPDGRLSLACDECQPFEMSGRSKPDFETGARDV